MICVLLNFEHHRNVINLGHIVPWIIKITLYRRQSSEMQLWSSNTYKVYCVEVDGDLQQALCTMLGMHVSDNLDDIFEDPLKMAQRKVNLTLPGPEYPCFKAIHGMINKGSQLKAQVVKRTDYGREFGEHEIELSSAPRSKFSDATPSAGKIYCAPFIVFTHLRYILTVLYI